MYRIVRPEHRARIRSFGLLLFIVATASAGVPSDASMRIESANGDAPHDIRMSLAELALGESSMEIRVRFFWDDLQLAVMERTSDMEFRLAETAEVDRVVEQYINELLVVEANGVVTTGTLEERGVEDAARADEVMWWYRLAYDVPAGVGRIHIQNRLLFNMFEDQRNIVHVKTRSGKERAYYFAWDEDNVTIPVS